MSATSCESCDQRHGRSRRRRPAAGRGSRRAAAQRACATISSRASTKFSGGSADRVVGGHLDRGAALAEQDHRAEHRVGRDADDQFVRVAAVAPLPAP